MVTLYLWPQVPHPSSGIPGEFQIRNINSGFARCAGFTGRSMVDLKDQVFICTFFFTAFDVGPGMFILRGL